MDNNAKLKAKTYNRLKFTLSIYHCFYMSKHLLKSIFTQIPYNQSNFYITWNTPMQTIIRKSVFETNSSSCHSLCIKKGDSANIAIPTDVHFDKDGVLTFELGCYGFGSYNLPNFNKKFSYLMTYLLMSMSNAVTDLEFVFTAVHEVVPFTKAMLFSEKLKDDMWEMQKLTIASFDETTNKIQIHLDNLKVIKDNFESYDYYIDHESIGLLSPILNDLWNNDSSSLKRLLFVDESYIHIDDDNKENIRYADGGFDEVKTQMHKLFKSLNPSWNTDALVNLFNGKKDLTYLFLDLHSMWKANNAQALNIFSSNITSVIYDHYDLYITDYYEEQEPKTYEQFLFEFIEQLLQKQVAQEDKDFLTNGKSILSFVASNDKSCASDFFETDFGKCLDKLFIQMVKNKKHHFNEHNYPFPFRTSEYGELALKTNIDETTTKLTKEEHESEPIRECYQKWLKTLINTDGTFNDSMIMDYLVLQNVDKQFDIQKWIDGCNYQYFR